MLLPLDSVRPGLEVTKDFATLVEPQELLLLLTEDRGNATMSV